MGHKNISYKCRKSQNLGSDFNNIKESKCPECGLIMKLMSYRFRPPQTDDIKKRKVVELLVSVGIEYQHIYDEERINTYLPYPETMKQAKQSVIKYRDQRINSQA